ncbi:hypothetical protein Q5H92_16760 [Hymenobacter sp. M29]|uniref:Uncharacterized protein n=1 Tax=Hymenobacter mellowenesis TaxID=3063995 RepID=A0ABT9ADT3_9BACT|nr:hypothetical protein [Hymenobacter sp. M29]MDO7848018.1 hypothetical protein [Hymenobacter sp. M29]
MKVLLVLSLLALSIPRAQAQVDPAAVAQGQVLSGMMRGHAERDRKAQLSGKRPIKKPLTPAEQRAAHRREVEEAMRRPPARPGSVR